jgi:hypothetical protein
MTEWKEYDFDNPAHWRPRRRRPTIEYMEPEDEQPRVTIELHHRFVPRPRERIPPWLIVLVGIALLMWWAPLGTIVAIALMTVFATAHSTLAISLAASLAMVIVIGIVQRLRGHLF